MKKISLASLLFLCAFVGPRYAPTRTMSGNDFIVNLNCSGPGCVDPLLVFPTPDAVSGAYPSPLTPNEQAGIYVPGNPALRGYDQSYSVIVGGNYSVSSNGGREVEGRVAIGGNLIIDNIGYGMSQSGGGTFVVGDGGSTFPVAVQGSVSGSGTLGVGFNKGGSYIVRSGGPNTVASSGGSAGQSKSQNQGTSGVNISTIIADMKSYSKIMCSAIPTGVASGAGFVGTNATNEVFTVNNSSLIGNLSFTNIAPGATVLVNIEGSGSLDVNWTARIGRTAESGTADADATVYNVIFNFCDATNVSFNNSFIGTVLIPNGGAEIKQSFDGRIYASGNLVHSGESSEIHNYPFIGDLTPYTPSTLPVTLMSFQAVAGIDGVDLKWATQSEVDFSHFEIQHSNNARNWEKIGEELAEGNGKTENKLYTFTHTSPEPGAQYYRLKMVDLDGSFEFSRVQNAFVDGNARLVVSPNPASSQFAITGLYNPEKQFVHVKIFNAAGKLLQAFSRSADQLEFPVSKSWPKGMLVIQVGVGGGAEKSMKLLNQ
ncbi:choice-of-anchor A family protein [Dyadobacter arcticus]|uniref:Choice-of-anchor A domain-containing protein n=1 Tax=Dyadobacter arcticus TaxID=1078754 RepID=A0ABX0UK92_9BACT|nr:choice-of-anchor A family protein [Dyadobacter arcticus]NIJ53366.1 choice-of-anchor A domain-containing protein [Dyadobacter arcticus]